MSDITWRDLAEQFERRVQFLEGELKRVNQVGFGCYHADAARTGDTDYSRRADGVLTVGELIRMLERFSPSMPISITDGYEVLVYEYLAGCAVESFTADDGVEWCDIGIGGCHRKQV
jgi:hypothetical protein